MENQERITNLVSSFVEQIKEVHREDFEVKEEFSSTIVFEFHNFAILTLCKETETLRVEFYDKNQKTLFLSNTVEFLDCLDSNTLEYEFKSEGLI